MSAEFTARPGWRTWDTEGARCAHCCNGDRCDDPTHYERTKCPHCLGTGFALWTKAGRWRHEEAQERIAKYLATPPQGTAP